MILVLVRLAVMMTEVQVHRDGRDVRAIRRSTSHDGVETRMMSLTRGTVRRARTVRSTLHRLKPALLARVARTAAQARSVHARIPHARHARLVRRRGRARRARLRNGVVVLHTRLLREVIRVHLVARQSGCARANADLWLVHRLVLCRMFALVPVPGRVLAFPTTEEEQQQDEQEDSGDTANDAADDGADGCAAGTAAPALGLPSSIGVATSASARTGAGCARSGTRSASGIVDRPIGSLDGSARGKSTVDDGIVEFKVGSLGATAEVDQGELVRAVIQAGQEENWSSAGGPDSDTRIMAKRWARSDRRHTGTIGAALIPSAIEFTIIQLSIDSDCIVTDVGANGTEQLDRRSLESIYISMSPLLRILD